MTEGHQPANPYVCVCVTCVGTFAGGLAFRLLRLVGLIEVAPQTQPTWLRHPGRQESASHPSRMLHLLCYLAAPESTCRHFFASPWQPPPWPASYADSCKEKMYFAAKFQLKHIFHKLAVSVHMEETLPAHEIDAVDAESDRCHLASGLQAQCNKTIKCKPTLRDLAWISFTAAWHTR
jgi:hypothetical protein